MAAAHEHHDIHEIDDRTTWRNIAMVVASLVGVTLCLVVAVSLIT